MVTQKQTGILSWPPGGREQKYLVLNVPGITDRLISDALSFISNYCYLKGERTTRKKFIHLPGVQKINNIPTKRTVAMERLFVEGTKDGVDNDKNVDGFRFQSGRGEDTKLMADAAIRAIVTHATQVVRGFDPKFEVVNVNVLYSKANGKPQGAHMDECRTKQEIKEQGEMISAIVPLMENTSLDVFNKEHRRNRITISPTMMFVFGADLMHGGADYKVPNARLHMYFVRGGSKSLDNTVMIGDICPHEDCEKRRNGTIFTTMQLRDHWNFHHKEKERMTAGQYAAKKEGRLFRCRHCKAYSIGKKGYNWHKKLCPSRAAGIVASNENVVKEVAKGGERQTRSKEISAVDSQASTTHEAGILTRLRKRKKPV